MQDSKTPQVYTVERAAAETIARNEGNPEQLTQAAQRYREDAAKYARADELTTAAACHKVAEQIEAAAQVAKDRDNPRHVYNAQGFCIYCQNTHQTDPKRNELCEFKTRNATPRALARLADLARAHRAITADRDTIRPADAIEPPEGFRLVQIADLIGAPVEGLRVDLRTRDEFGRLFYQWQEKDGPHASTLKAVTVETMKTRNRETGDGPRQGEPVQVWVYWKWNPCPFTRCDYSGHEVSTEKGAQNFAAYYLFVEESPTP